MIMLFIKSLHGMVVEVSLNDLKMTMKKKNMADDRPTYMSSLFKNNVQKTKSLLK